MKTIKRILTLLLTVVTGMIAQTAGAQNCSGGKVMMSMGAKGCGCWGCTKLCVPANEVATYQSNGWRIGNCPHGNCCNWVRMGDEEIKTETALKEIYPNPASGLVTISFSLAEQSIVSLQVFDLTGRYVATVADNFFEDEDNELTWDTNVLNCGVYFLKMQTDSYSETKKISVIN